jgi:hypothetical protein
MSTIDSTCTTKVTPNNLGEAAGYTGNGPGVTNDAIESQNHARKPLANVWLTRPQRRLRCAALLSSVEELLVGRALLCLYKAGGHAVGDFGRATRLFASRPSALEAILDALRVEKRGRVASFRPALASCPYHERARSAHGQDEVRTLDSQRLRLTAALG